MAIHIRRTLGHSALSTREEESTTSNYAVIHRELFVFPPRNATTGNLFDYSHPSKSSISTSSSRDGEEKIFVLNHLNDGVNTSYGSRNHVFGKSYNGDEQINNSPDPMLCIVIILLMGIFFHLTFTLMLNGRLDRKSCLPSFICRGSPDDEEDANNANNNDSIQPTQADEESAVAISNDRDNDQLQKIQKERATFVDDALITTTFASIMRNSTSKIGDNNSEVSLEGFVTSVRSEASLSSSSSGSADSFVPGSSSESLLQDEIDDTTNIRESPIKNSNDTSNSHEETFLSIATNAAMIIDESTTTTIVTTNESNEHIDANISSTSCAICLEPYQPNDRLSYSKYRQCTHVFHTDCIVSWLVDQKRDDCPYCRGRYILQFGDRGGDDCRNVVRHDNVGGNYVVNGFSGAREDFGFSPNTARDEDTVNVELSHIDVG
mmetsp:Transcript_14729/g.31431  ORF Transcript_14729/g.31431 Transcript_14729/m.31431 type:complete len:435 (+) Transcript_14729:84-1388(+)